MNKDLHATIKQLEAKWLAQAETFVSELFNDIYLPSHDIKHHLRCWENAKELIINVSEEAQPVNEHKLEGLLLACIFHDTGMVKTLEPEHGRESKKFFSLFIDALNTKPHALNQIQEAIELHDKKNYAEADPIKPGEPVQILKYLSIADDMDAFGTIGVYRYAEIYLMRNVPMEDLGTIVIQNVRKRFNYFLQSTLSFPNLHEVWQQKYDDIITFFENYNYQINRHESIHSTFSGPMGVINYIKQFSIGKQIMPDYFLTEIKKKKTDIFTNAFFHKLHHELKL